MSKCLTLALLIFSQTTGVRAALGPDEVAIIAVRTSKQSRELAEYYAEARAIPKSQICVIDCPLGETLSRRDWEAKVRPAIRNWLVSNNLDQKIRCLVTVWDVPLKIGAIDAANPVLVGLKTNFETQRLARQKQIIGLAGEIDRLLVAKLLLERKFPKPEAPQKEYSDLLEEALKRAQGRIREAKDEAAAAHAAQQLEQLYLRGGGLSAVLRAAQAKITANAPANPEMVRAFDIRQGELAGLRAGENALAGVLESPSRDLQILGLLQQTDGLLGALSWIEQQQELWTKNETHASFDNELSLVLWMEHPLLRWQNNVWLYTFEPSVREMLPTTMMVARLEAPTFELTKQLINTGITVENEGLAGKFYLDARGLQAEKNPGSYGDYDQNLRDLGAWLKENTKLEVIVDNEGKLFQAGECPGAALYCGWYSLANYVDAFSWKPGSVAYHIASSEADTLRKPGSNVWCKKMLERGVCGTLGPVYEPYLSAFPRPLDFFTLLLSGKLPLGEVYARTNPYTSWVMVLVGDPLYNPFKNAPQITRDKLPDTVRFLLDSEP